ncbi:GyrI-like domain-containing protein [Sulfurimonas sp.]|uniref:AraC family transcriptional regulator n=1 Tax=Sulfurimonas sp. TaxID=2022749 RepID=UPI002616015E|nr:GyrI-like domain-containing protein [Sulfurimonas sp.]
MKKETLHKRLKIANDIMFYIYTNIDTHIDVEELSQDLSISKFHMQRVFKEVFHRNIYESIRAIRLQKASNLLLTNRYSTISNIANMCGYSSQSSFIKAFKARFFMTPKEWKNGGFKEYSSKLLNDYRKQGNFTQIFENLEPQILTMEPIKSYYIRNHGYIEKNIKESWQKLYAWSFSNNIQEYKHIALFHDNPTITPLIECQYVACIATNENVLSDRLPNFVIAGGLYAKFDIQGKKGEFLHFIQWVYHKWLLESEYETCTKPAYAIYHKNKYLRDDDLFDVSFYLPIIF